MARRVFRWRHGEVVEGAPRQARPVHFIQDCYSDNPVLSSVDMKPIASRADLREHNKRNNVVDVGNDKSMFRIGEKVSRPGEGLRDDLQRIYSEYDA